MSQIGRRLRIAILERDGYRCVYCGRSADETALEVDHIHAVSRGGTNDPRNLVTACSTCNGGKSASAVALPDAAILGRPLPAWYVNRRPSPTRRRGATLPGSSRALPEPVRWRKVAAALGLIDPPFPVGRFFARWYTSDRDGDRWWQTGIVVAVDADTAWVRFFTSDGPLGDATQSVALAPFADWRFFETDRAMRRWVFAQGALKGLWPAGDDEWEYQERVVALFSGPAA